jgi:hypothetical protein
MLDNSGNIGKWHEFDENTIKVGKFIVFLPLSLNQKDLG